MGTLIGTVLQNRWIPHKPTLKQARFLMRPEREALYGGAAGSGKSDCLLMGALQYADVPGYAALLLRRTYADLALPGLVDLLCNSGLLEQSVGEVAARQ